MSGNDVTPESKPRRRAAGRPAGPPVDAPAAKAEKAEKAPAKKKAAATKKAPIAVPVFQAAPVTAVTPAKKKAAAKPGEVLVYDEKGNDFYMTEDLYGTPGYEGYKRYEGMLADF